MMYKKKEENLNVQNINIIGAATRLKGELTSSGDIRIDGHLEGDLETTAKLVTGGSSTITGDVRAQQADVSGLVDGNIHVKDILILKATARIKGNIYAKKMIVESGARFDGQCHMDSLEEVKEVTQNSTENKAKQVAR